MISHSNVKCFVVCAAIALAPALATAEPGARPAERVHVDLGLFDTMIDARRAWKKIVGVDDSLMRLDPIFGQYRGQTSANVFFIAPSDAAAVCQAARRSAAETCTLFD